MSPKHVDDYDPKQADYNLRETISNIKGQIDQIYFGFLDKLSADKKESFIARLKISSDKLYTLLSEAILDKANKIKELHKVIVEDLNMARTIQREILSCELSSGSSLDFHIRYQPMTEVGGDLYNVFELRPGVFRIFLADATGHGVQAALITMLIKSEYEVIKKTAAGPKEIAESLNTVFFHTFRKLNVFFTAVFADINTAEQSITYTLAGHPDQYILRDSQVHPLSARNILLGAMEDSHFDENTAAFLPGDTLLLFTDGLFEEFGSDESDEYGEDRLLESIRQHAKKAPAELINAIIEDVSVYIRGDSWNDDLVLIGVEYTRQGI